MRRWMLLLGVGAVMIAMVGLGAWVYVQANQVYQAGNQAYEEQNTDLAEHFFTRAARYPGILGDFVGEAKLRLGEIQVYRDASDQWQKGEYVPAVELYTKFVQAYPGSVYSAECVQHIGEYRSYQQAEALWQQKAYEAAVEAYEEHLRLYPKSPFQENSKAALHQIPLDWAKALGEQGDYRAAVDQCDCLLAMAGISELTRQQAEVLRQEMYLAWAEQVHGQGDFAAATEIYLKLDKESKLDVHPALAQVYLNWGEQLRQAGEFAQAIEKFEQIEPLTKAGATKLNQASERIQETLLDWANQLLADGSSEQAGEIYGRLVLSPDSKLAGKIPVEAQAPLVEYGQRLLDADKYAQAGTIFEYVIELPAAETGITAKAQRGLGEALYGQKDYFGAAAAYEKALGLLKTKSERTEIEGLKADAIYQIGQLPQTHSKVKPLLAIFGTLVVEEKKLDLTKQRCASGVCFTPEELQVAHQAIGQEPAASRFVLHSGSQDYLPGSQLATHLGHLRYATEISTEEVLVQTCNYSPTGFPPYIHFLKRIQIKSVITIYDLTTGRKVTSQTLMGSSPAACPQRRGFSQTTEYQKGNNPAMAAYHAVFARYEKKVSFSRAFLNETFNSDASQWSLGEVAGNYWNGSRVLVSGWLQFSGVSQSSFWSLVTPEAEKYKQNLFAVKVSLKVKAPVSEAFYGLVLRATANRFYAFLIDEKQENFAFMLWSGGEFQELAKWKRSPAIDSQPGAVNQLVVEAVGKVFTLYINGQQVGQVEDGTIASGQQGVLVGCWEAGKTFTVQFDDFVVNTP